MVIKKETIMKKLFALLILSLAFAASARTKIKSQSLSADGELISSGAVSQKQPIIEFGTYTPIELEQTGGWQIGRNYSGQWYRIGNLVHVSLGFNCDVSGAGFHGLDVTVPIPRPTGNIGSHQVGGVVSSTHSSVDWDYGYVAPDDVQTNNSVRITTFWKTNSPSNGCNATFTYRLD
jgi:hypothetical protein